VFRLILLAVLPLLFVPGGEAADKPISVLTINDPDNHERRPATRLVRGPKSGNSSEHESASMPDIGGEGWQPLFNGNDLKGWTQKNGTATYRVEDDTIVGKTAEGSPNSFLCTDDTYTDFELTFEVQVDPGLNSGVQIRSLSKPEFKNGRVHGPQVEIETAPGESGYLYSEGTGRGWITTEQPTAGTGSSCARSAIALRLGLMTAKSPTFATPSRADPGSSDCKCMESKKKPDHSRFGGAISVSGS